MAEGTSTPRNSGAQTVSFQMIEGVDIYGGFSGTEKQEADRDWESHPTFLSGDLNGDDSYTGAGIESRGDENSKTVVKGANKASRMASHGVAGRTQQ